MTLARSVISSMQAAPSDTDGDTSAAGEKIRLRSAIASGDWYESSGSLNPSASGGTSQAQGRIRQPFALSAFESSWDWSDTPSVPNSLKCISSVLIKAAPPSPATPWGCSSSVVASCTVRSACCLGCAGYCRGARPFVIAMVLPKNEASIRQQTKWQIRSARVPPADAGGVQILAPHCHGRRSVGLLAP